MSHSTPSRDPLGCDGDCEEHTGARQTVHVTHPPTKKDWGNFVYCQSAIEVDKRRGLAVEVVNAE